MVIGRRTAGGLLASAALISALTVLARATGFARQLVFSGSVGATCVGDTYNAANLLPNVLFEVVAGGALSAALVPLLAPLLPDRRDAAARLASAVLTWTVLLLIPLVAILVMAADPIAGLLVGGDCPGQRELAAAMIVVFAPQVALYGVGAVLAGLLQAAGRFGWPAFAPVASSVVVITGYLGYAAVVGDDAAAMTGDSLPRIAFVALVWGTTAGVAAMTLPLLLPVRGAGLRLRPTLRLPAGTGRQAARLGASGVLAVLAQQAFTLAVLLLAARRSLTGTLVAFGYTQALWMLPFAVLVAPLITALFPRLARAASEGSRPDEFAELCSRFLRAVLIAALGGAALLAATAPAVGALFAALDRGDVGPMSVALLVAAPGTFGFAILLAVARALYALSAPGAAAVATSIGWGSAILAAVAATSAVPPAQSLIALAGGQSAGMLAGAAAGLLLVRARAGPAALMGLRGTTVLAVPAAVLAAAAGWGLARFGVATWSPGVPGSAGFAVLAALVTGIIALIALVGPVSDLFVDPGEQDPAVDTSGAVLMVLGPSGGGIGRHVQALARGVAARGSVVVVAAPPATLERFGYGDASTVPFTIGDRPNPLRDLAAVRRLRSLARAAAVVHAHGLRAGALAVLACRRDGVPVLVTLHNARLSGGAAGRLHGVLEWIVARGSSAVLVVSADLGTRIRALGGRDVQTALVPAPPRQQASHPDQARRRIREELGLPPQRALLVCVARLAPQKGLPVLLDAAGLLAGLDVQVVVAGDGPLHDDLAADITTRDLPVRLLGRREDVPDLLAAADLVLVPSLWEGQPLIVQEALRAGAAIVATDAGGTADVLGGAGRLVSPGDAAALAQTVRDLLGDPAAVATLAEAARRRSAELPTDDDAADQAMRHYRRLSADSLEPRGEAHS